MKGDGLGAEGWADEDEDEERWSKSKISVLPTWRLPNSLHDSNWFIEVYGFIGVAFDAAWRQVLRIFQSLLHQDENATKGPGRELLQSERRLVCSRHCLSVQL